jgi:RNA polymerase subunit RPABC4/transcription elongation factor Spt4
MIELVLIGIFIVLVIMLLRGGRRRRHGRGLFEFERKCPHCREIISGRATVCPHCQRETGWGKRSATSFFDAPCPHCHAIVNRWAKVCPSCGQSTR